MSASRIEYSEKYADDVNEYRYVFVFLRDRAIFQQTTVCSRIEVHVDFVPCLTCSPCLEHSSHVILPKELAKTLPKSRLLTEAEWRQIGVQQSRGWTHYAIHRPEPHILLFRRPLGTDPQSGRVDPELERLAREEYKNQFGIQRK